jgi:hypothetical protein
VVVYLPRQMWSQGVEAKSMLPMRTAILAGRNPEAEAEDAGQSPEYTSTMYLCPALPSRSEGTP